MRAKTVLVLAVVCALALSVVVVVKLAQSRPTGWAIGQKIAPRFPINGVERIVVRNSGGTVTVGKDEGIWRVAEYYDFPANFAKVVELLQQVYEMQVGQHQKVRGTSLGRLRLLGPAAAGTEESGQGTAVAFFTKGATPVFEMIVGNHKQRARDPQDPYGFPTPEGTYIRIASASAGVPSGSESVLIVKDIISLPASAEGWIERQILNIPSDEVREISVRTPAGEGFTLSRTNSTDAFSMADLPATQQVNIATANSLAGALSYFTIQKVVPPSEASTSTVLETAWTFSVRTADGITYRMTLADTNAPDAYARLEVKFDAQYAEGTTNAVDELKEKADMLQARFGGWLYVLPSYKINELRKTRDDVITSVPSTLEGEKDEAGEDEAAEGENEGALTNEVSGAAAAAGEELKEERVAPEHAGTEQVDAN